jgi:hypothetical protein
MQHPFEVIDKPMQSDLAVEQTSVRTWRWAFSWKENAKKNFETDTNAQILASRASESL